jgi:recombination protein RecA
VLDVALERKLVQKSGSYFSYGDERLGQGRQNATAFLREHPDVTEQILRSVQAELGPDAVVSSRLLPMTDDAAAAEQAKPEKAEKKEASEVASAS